MRQVFQQYPWIYHEEPPEIADIFFRYGKRESLKRGVVIQHGGADGRIYYLHKGLAKFASTDRNGKRMTFCLILPGRAMADIDGVTRERVNIKDTLIRPSEVLSLDHETWIRCIANNPRLMLKAMLSIIAKHESHMEAMIANFTLPLAERLCVFFKVLHCEYHKEIEEWNKVPLYLSAEEYAELMGATRVSISRLFAQWRREGLLRKEGRDMHIHRRLFDGVYDWQDQITDYRGRKTERTRRQASAHRTS